MLTQKVKIYNLPAQPTSFIGREPEIAEIVGVLNDVNCRLLTLLGPGGIGKTRLSIESIDRLTTSRFEHGIFYVPLAPLTSADDIVTTVIGVLGIMIGDKGTPQEELVKFLTQRNLLLVMDNFEHVLDGADLVADILNVAPDVKILVTSREALNLQQEWVWQVKGMRFPENTTLDDIDQYSALKLFLDRARRVQHNFSAVDNQACAIRICQLVDGMPLAIELSASWLKTLSCHDIISQIEHGIDFLSTRTRDITERHRSIRAVFDHSWNLLSLDERAVFSRLSVFRGGFTRDVAEKVATADLLTLSRLVEKSMVRRDETGRYDVHELLRQYAEEKLDAIGDKDRTISAYTAFFSEFMREHTIDIKGRRQLEGLNEIEADWDNIVAAWYRALRIINYEALNNMMEGLALYCDMRAHYQLGEHLFQYAREQSRFFNSGVPPSIVNRIQLRYIQVSTLSFKFPMPTDIHQQLSQSYALATQHEDATAIGLCLWLQCEIDSNLEVIPQTITTILPKLEQTLNHYKQLGDDYYVARILRLIVHCYNVRGINKDKAQLLNNQCIEIVRRIGDRNGLAHALLREEAYVNYASKYKLYLDAAQIYREVGDRKSVGTMMMFLSEDRFCIGAFDEATHMAQSSYKTRHDIGHNTEHDFFDLILLGLIAGLKGDRVQSYQLLTDNIARYQIYLFHREYYTLCNTLALAMLGWLEPTQSNHYIVSALQIASVPFIPIAVAGCISMIAVILAEQDNEDEAVALFGLAYSFSDEYLLGWMRESPLLRQVRDALKTNLGKVAYESAWKRGTQHSLQETASELLQYFGKEGSIRATPISQPLDEPLTERELEVLALIADGLTNPQIADKLYLSTGTVKVHSRNIYGKLGVGNRTEAVVVAQRLKLI